VCCHPAKAATSETLIPRGGGAFVNEMDGNTVIAKQDGLIELHWQVKFRGAEFPPISFRLKTVQHESLKDKRGRMIPTVIAEPISETGIAEMQKTQRTDEDSVLRTINATPVATPTDMARALGWTMHNGSPYQVKVGRIAKKLVQKKLLTDCRDGWELTEKGKAELKKLGAMGK
jgi:hypothetical protein